MPAFNQWIVDTNDDGYPDDIRAQISLDLPASGEGREFWSALLDLAARAGLETQSMTLPLVHDGSDTRDVEQVTVRSLQDIEQLQWEFGGEPAANTSAIADSSSACLTDLFTIDGALADRDGDLLPDATRLLFDLPDSLPTGLGSALANLTARIGLESGGVTLPLVGNYEPRFAVRPGEGEPVLHAVDGGWLAEGASTDLAALLNRVATDWPHITAPETGGVTAAIGWLRRTLTGDEPRQRSTGRLDWELQWSAGREVEALRDTFEKQLLPRLGRELPLDLTVFASEPPARRRRLADTLHTLLHEAGFESASVTVLCAFKAGLSWLRETVLPAMRKLPVSRVRITYRRYEYTGGPGEQLDLPIRWLQELFPGNELLASGLGIPLEAIEIVESAEIDGPIFNAEAIDAAGRTLGHWHCSPPHSRQPFIANLPDAGNVCVTSGGFVVEQDNAAITLAVETDLQRFWRFWQDEVIPRLLRRIGETGGAYAGNQPFFGRLEAEIWVSEPNSNLGVREENDSAAEALQEDIYFNTLDALESYGLHTTGERTSAPGSVVPVIHVEPGCTPHARVRLWSAPAQRQIQYPQVTVTAVRLADNALELDIAVEGKDDAKETLQKNLRAIANRDRPRGPAVRSRVSIGDRSAVVWLPLPDLIEGDRVDVGVAPPMDANIHGEAVFGQMQALAGYSEVSAWIEDESYEGWPIFALALSHSSNGQLRSPQKDAILKPSCLIVARHHANEISSTNAALQLAYLCATEPEWRRLLNRVNIVVLPYENPDGAALHARLAGDPAAETWKHHPARYNALGYEFSESFHDPDTRFGEARVRPALWERWKPDAVVDNHGVPSHEWVQPFSGFGSPPRFRVSYWIPQALIYGIISYVNDEMLPEHRRAMETVRDAVSRRIHETDLLERNRAYGSSYRFWGQSREPDHFPGEFHNQMLWHISAGPPDPENRRFSFRYPKTTALTWVTEVNDETATGPHLERTARAHLLANRAMLDAMAAAAPAVQGWRIHDGAGRTTLRIGRDRPLSLSPGHNRTTL